MNKCILGFIAIVLFANMFNAQNIKEYRANMEDALYGSTMTTLVETAKVEINSKGYKNADDFIKGELDGVSKSEYKLMVDIYNLATSKASCSISYTNTSSLKEYVSNISSVREINKLHFFDDALRCGFFCRLKNALIDFLIDELQGLKEIEF